MDNSCSIIVVNTEMIVYSLPVTDTLFHLTMEVDPYRRAFSTPSYIYIAKPRNESRL